MDRLPPLNSDRERFRLFEIHQDGTGRTFIQEFPFCTPQHPVFLHRLGVPVGMLRESPNR